MVSMTIKAEFLAGTSILEACKKAIDFAQKNDVDVEFNFNGVKIWCRPDSDAVALADKFLGMDKTGKNLFVM